MSCFQARRKALMDGLQSGSAVVIAAGNMQLRNGDVYFPFRQDSYFYYLTGFNEPHAILMMVKHSSNRFTSILFCRNRSRAAVARRSLRAMCAKRQLGIDHAFSDADFADKMPEYPEQ